MSILIVGRRGQLARSLEERGRLRRGMDLESVGRPDADLEKPGAIARAIADRSPDLIVNAAAYTAVDRAEDEPDRAFRINAEAAGEIAAAAAEVGCPLIHISTDYVFDGSEKRALNETDRVNPINVYGRSKLAGEEAVKAATDRHVILRTSWVYSPFGSNFVKTMVKLVPERNEVSVVDDQLGCPTSALDLADAILHVAGRIADGDVTGLGATYHLPGPGPCSWAQFAAEIFDACRAAGVERVPSVRPIRTEEYPTRAARPASSILDSGLFERTFDHRMRSRKIALQETVDRLRIGATADE